MRSDAPTDRPAWGGHVLGMDGLRGIAATTVLMGHVGAKLGTGDQPVGLTQLIAVAGQGLTLFFALSGFLLYRGFATAIVRKRPMPRIDRFFLNRALRIYPAYLVILVVVRLVVGVPAIPAPLNDTAAAEAPAADRMTDPLLWLANSTMLQSLFPESLGTGLAVSWTLTVELVFYLVMPALAAAVHVAARRSGRGAAAWALAPVGMLLATGLIGKVVYASVADPRTPAEDTYLEWGSNWTAVLGRSFFVHADLFAFGMAAAVVWTLCDAGRIAPHVRQAIRWTSAVGALVVLMAVKEGMFADTGYAALAGAVILFVALPAASKVPGALARVLESAPLKSLGLVSYSLYLWHLPVIWAMDRAGFTFAPTALGYWGNVAWILAASAALSATTYHLVEKPALRLKRRTEVQSVAEPASA